MPQPIPDDGLPAAGLPIRMIRPHLRDIPQHPFPEGYGVRPMGVDEGAAWDRLWQETEPFDNITDGLFHREFGHDAGLIEARCWFLAAPDGTPAGSISAWRDTLPDGLDYGQIHWVAVHPDHQGRGLSKALMTHAMNLLARWHERAFLGTATRRVHAVKVYLDFGFLPDMTFPEADRAWDIMRRTLPHPALHS